jgi:tRNA dimethylallyltransferase
LVLVGPTGVGKTRVAIDLARSFGGELVGGDSMQIYRGFDIGTAKPTAAELGGIRHHLLDVAEPEETLDAARYAELADAAIADIVGRGAVPIVVGGTGLWLRALLRGLVEVPKVDAALRARIEAEWDRDGSIAMHARLASVDPTTAALVHANDRMRVVRALEVHAQTGRALGELRAEHALGAPRHDALVLAIDVAPAHYRPAIGTRTRAMIEGGFAREVEHLVRKHGAHVRPLHSVGYKQMLAHVQATTSLEQTEADIVRATLGYARRQRTWWSTDRSVNHRMTPQDVLGAETRSLIERHLAGPLTPRSAS